jgi:soluble lytic murein transglycosylase-like protein
MPSGGSLRAARRALAAAALAASLPAAAQVYVEVDAQGALHLSDRPGAGERLPDQRPPEALIREVARSHAIDPLLVEAVIRAESGFDARALSAKGAAGLMQLMPGTARRYGVDDRFDPAQNVEGGVRYLRDLLARFEGNLGLALAAYNAGEDAVLRYGRIPPYAESQLYVRRVTAIYDRLREKKAAAPTGAAAGTRAD